MIRKEYDRLTAEKILKNKKGTIFAVKYQLGIYSVTVKTDSTFEHGFYYNYDSDAIDRAEMLTERKATIKILQKILKRWEEETNNDINMFSKPAVSPEAMLAEAERCFFNKKVSFIIKHDKDIHPDKLE